MLIYFIIFALFLLIAIGDKLYRKPLPFNKNLVFSIGCFTAVFLLMALRHPVMGADLGYGNDSSGYIFAFHKFAGMSWKELWQGSFQNYEKGYMVFSKLVATVFPNTQFFLIVIAAVTYIPVFWLIFKKSSSPILSAAIYMALPVFWGSFSSVRQTVALGLCTVAMLFIDKKKLWYAIPFAALVGIAATIHKSSIFFILAYPLCKIKLNRIASYISAGLLLVLWLVRLPLARLAVDVAGLDIALVDNGSYRLFFIYLAIYVGLCIFADDEDRGWLNMFFVVCGVQILGSMITNVQRLAWGYMIPLVFLIPSAIKHFPKQKLQPYLEVAALVAFSLWALYGLYSMNAWTHSVPYVPFWEEVSTQSLANAITSVIIR